ncbi:TIGR03086 family metal-binding protein [Prauserella alba]|uniref:TIGR03086 family metal-binding protein n=1 Tax=Prauserella alba TaxID=176898 RepID=A0ABP4FU44_9PSEU|nr:TIGR03086 family metal-binding protein [Prauserella alba]MCP2181729.1 TIGR03086 family protein [Prauserella alba]
MARSQADHSLAHVLRSAPRVPHSDTRELRQRLQDYADARGWVVSLMSGTDAEQLAGPTPCAELDVRTLMAHLIGTAHRGLGTALGTPARDIPFAVTDVPDADLATTYARLSDEIAAAWATLEPDEEVRAPWGACTASAAAGGFTVETVTHGWDLAVATGRPTAFADPVAERCLGLGAPIVPRRLRGVMYDEPITPAEEATPIERLAALLGRRPAIRATTRHGTR